MTTQKFKGRRIKRLRQKSFARFQPKFELSEAEEREGNLVQGFIEKYDKNTRTTSVRETSMIKNMMFQ